MNITEFLLARIAEDEAEAQVAKAEFAHGGYGCYGPARVLAECAAKRALLTPFRSGVKFEVGAGDVTGWISPLTIMAIPYKDHPDYQEAWAVGG